MRWNRRGDSIFRNTGRPTILFVDEVHRFDKAQQDAFLLRGIGAAHLCRQHRVEDPSFEVNNALLSRAAVYVLKSLTPEDLGTLLQRALPDPNSRRLRRREIEGGRLVALADGDGRRLLDLLEQTSTAAELAKRSSMDEAFIEQAVTRRPAALRRRRRFLDHLQHRHSVRGSNPDASLSGSAACSTAAPIRAMSRGASSAWRRRTWACRSARAGNHVECGHCLYERLRSPKGELALAEAVIYLACAAKSNAIYPAYNEARAFVGTSESRPVPVHLQRADPPHEGAGIRLDYRTPTTNRMATPRTTIIFPKAWKKRTGTGPPTRPGGEDPREACHCELDRQDRQKSAARNERYHPQLLLSSPSAPAGVRNLAGRDYLPLIFFAFPAKAEMQGLIEWFPTPRYALRDGVPGAND